MNLHLGHQEVTTCGLDNGRRWGDSASFWVSCGFELRTIPIALVERVGVLPAWSSAVYGGDGLAGVINIVLRRDANGFEFRYRRSSAKGYAVTQAGAVWGKSWQKGDMTVAVNWRENGELFNDERSLTADSDRSEEHTSELQSLMRISYADFCLK